MVSFNFLSFATVFLSIRTFRTRLRIWVRAVNCLTRFRNRNASSSISLFSRDFVVNSCFNCSFWIRTFSSIVVNISIRYLQSFSWLIPSIISSLWRRGAYTFELELKSWSLDLFRRWFLWSDVVRLEQFWWFLLQSDSSLKDELTQTWWKKI